MRVFCGAAGRVDPALVGRIPIQGYGCGSGDLPDVCTAEEACWDLSSRQELTAERKPCPSVNPLETRSQRIRHRPWAAAVIKALTRS